MYQALVLMVAGFTAFAGGQYAARWRRRGVRLRRVPDAYVLASLLALLVLVVVADAPVVLQLLFLLPAAVMLGWFTSVRPGDDLRWPGVSLPGWRMYGTAGFLLIVAFLVRIPDLGEFGLRQDAFHHFETAIGYLRTGRFVQWDFLRGEPGRPYGRAWMYTWQVAWVFRWAGVSYGYARLVSLTWGMLLFVPVWLYCRSLSLRSWETLGVTFWIAVSPHFITAARWIRMYAMFVTLYVALVVAIRYVLHARSRWKTLTAWAAMVPLGVLAAHLHLLAGLAVPAVVGYGLSEGLAGRMGRDTGRRFVLFLAGLLVVVLLLIGVFEGSMLYWGSGGVDSEVGIAGVYPGYLIYLVADSVEYALGGLLLAAVVFFCRETPTERFYLWMLALPVLSIVVFITRFPMYRYMSPMIPLVLPFFLLATRRLVRRLGTESGPLIGAVLLVAFVIVPVSDLRGTLAYIWKGNMGYVHFMGVKTGRMDPVIDEVRPRLRRGDYVGLYYWKHSTYYLSRFHRPGVTVERYPREGFLTVEDLRRLERNHQRVWIIYREWMLRDLPPETERYLERNYRRVLPRERYHMNVFLGSSDGAGN